MHHIVYAATSGGGISPWLIIVYVAFFGAIWYFMIRPQSQQQRRHRELVEGLKKGDRVITSGGLHGVVVDTKEEVLILRIAPKIDVTVQRSAVQTVAGRISKEDQRRQEREKAPSELGADDVSNAPDDGTPS